MLRCDKGALRCQAQRENVAQITWAGRYIRYTITDVKRKRGSTGFESFITNRQHEVLIVLAGEAWAGREITATRIARVLRTHKNAALSHLNSLTSKGLLGKESVFIRGRREERYHIMWNAASAIVGIPDLDDAPSAQRQGRAARNVLIQEDIFAGKPMMRATVTDDTLSGRGLMRGDMVLVSPNDEIKDGDVVAVEIGREQRIGFQVAPVRAKRADDRIWGKVVRVIKSL